MIGPVVFRQAHSPMRIDFSYQLIGTAVFYRITHTYTHTHTHIYIYMYIYIYIYMCVCVFVCVCVCKRKSE